MVLKQYGIIYKRVKSENLEMLRQWRNHPDIVRFMIKRDYITEEMQEAWFKSINNNKNYYFIISLEGFDIGLIHCKDIDFDNKTGETGIFIFDKAYTKTKVFLYASMSIINFAFYHLRLDKLYINVVKENLHFLKIINNLNFIEDISYTGCIEKRFYLMKEAYEKLFEKHANIKKMLNLEKDSELIISQNHTP
ncbi:MAG: GNAT family N-acetyltransferase [Bacteroidales bacterium]|nr:GNAT family N-acetyltransferase [Bacteroidales bacterium]